MLTGPLPLERQRFALRSVWIDGRRRARRVAARALVASLVVVLPAACVVTAALAFVPLAAAVMWVGAMLLPRFRWGRPGPGVIEIEGSALTVIVDRLGSARRLRRYAVAELAHGYRTDDEVRLETRRGETLVLGIDDAAVGEEVLRALGLDARRRVLEVRLASIASRAPGAVSLVWVMLATQAPGIIAAPFLVVFRLLDGGGTASLLPLLVTMLGELVFVAGAVIVLRRRVAAIGMDGIVFRRFLRRRFYPYGAVADVTLAFGGVTLALRSGQRVRLRTQGIWSRARVDDDARALFERIETARAAASGPDLRTKLQLLDRRGRSAGEWRAHLATLVGASSYRTGAVTARDLAAAIDDATLSAEHRVAATLALRAAEPEEARTRARIAAAACADGELRAALDRAADGEIDDGQLDRVVARGG